MVDRPRHLAASYAGGQFDCSGAADAWRIVNPANLESNVGAAIPAGAATAIAAVDSAEHAFSRWRDTSVEDRAHLLRLLVQKVRERHADFVSIITLENGKTVNESAAEVQGALREAEFQIDRIASGTISQAFPMADVNGTELRHEPLGVVLAITPWNFPLAAIVRKMIPALMTGNTVVVKPSPATPLTAAMLFEVLHGIDLPAGTANLVLTPSVEVAEGLVNDPRVRAITFTGSTRTGLELERQTAGRAVRLQAEMGGKNAMVVLADADLDLALKHVAMAAFGIAGQWCVGTSRLILEEPIYDRFLARFAEQTEATKIGDGMHPTTVMGPVISAAQVERFLAVITLAQKEGARLLVGGRQHETMAGKRGHYVDATVFADVKPEMTLAREEIFLPVVAAIRAKNLDDAIQVANATDYGLSCSIYTKNHAMGERFMREVDCGICHVNLPTYHRDVAMPLCAWKASGRGMPECGRTAFEFFTRPRAVYRGVQP